LEGFYCDIMPKEVLNERWSEIGNI
jgi:hypothetical protein